VQEAGPPGIEHGGMKRRAVVSLIIEANRFACG
jgi:hypothetical protein